MSKRRFPSVKATASADPNEIGQPDLRAFALILCATLVAYLPALGGSLLWDDSNYVTPPELQSLHGLWQIWSDLAIAATHQYYPLLHSAFWFEHVMWGDAVLGYPISGSPCYKRDGPRRRLGSSKSRYAFSPTAQ
jgi:hypothetical protein